MEQNNEIQQPTQEELLAWKQELSQLSDIIKYGKELADSATNLISSNHTNYSDKYRELKDSTKKFDEYLRKIGK